MAVDQNSIILRISFRGGNMYLGESWMYREHEVVKFPSYGDWIPGGDDAFIKLFDRFSWMLLKPVRTNWWPQGPEWFSGTFKTNVFVGENDQDVFTLEGWDYPGDPGGGYTFRQLWHKQEGVAVVPTTGMAPVWHRPGVSPPGYCEPIMTDALFREGVKRAEEIQREILRVGAEAGVQTLTILDPTGISSVGMGVYDFSKGDLLGGCLNMLGGIPLLGDFLGRMPRTAMLLSRLAELSKRLDRIVKAIADAQKVRETIPEIASAMKTISSTSVDILAAKAARQAQKLRVSELEKLWATGTKTPQEIEEGMSAVPMLRNPPLLAKHGEGASLDALRMELKQKGFVKVKSGQAGPRFGGENSDVWVRKIKGKDGESYWEFVR